MGQFEKLCSLISPTLNIRDDFLASTYSTSEKKSFDSLTTLSALLCSVRKLIKYSKPNAVRACRNAFMRDFPDFVEIYPICQPSAVLPDISLISLSIGSYLELAIFREDFSSAASVNVRFSRVFYFVFICCYNLNSPHNEMRTGPSLFSLGAFPTLRSHDFRHGCLYVESSEGGRGRYK